MRTHSPPLGFGVMGIGGHLGESICGEGWAENEACLRSMQSEPMVIECPNKKPITQVLFASYGIPVSRYQLHRCPGGRIFVRISQTRSWASMC